MEKGRTRKGLSRDRNGGRGQRKRRERKGEALTRDWRYVQ